ncbi:sugar phosphate isomerase/epimerase family protein [Ruegeria hyattellae]|uniref:sugar phosphate isomerase/epimerase family protein n=1 Tax=Ruegeria hyattellae TaxID=3233337 RepID=UPI00355BC2CA
MKLGVNLLCVGGLIEVANLEHCRLASQEGYDGIEIAVQDGSPNNYGWLGAQLDAIGLERACTAIVPDPGADPTSADPAIRTRGIAHLDGILDCTTALGARIIGGPFHAPIGQFTGKGPTTDEWQRGTEAHYMMAEKVAERGIPLARELLNWFETHFLNAAEQAAQFCDMVGHPTFGTMFDTFCPHIEEKDPVGAFRALAGRINVLLVSENDRGIAVTVQIDCPSVFMVVKATGFDDWVLMEASGAGVPEIAAATRIWRPMFDNYTTQFRDSARLIQDTWEQA